MDNLHLSFFDQALAYLRRELGPPMFTTSTHPRRASWTLPDGGPNAGVIRVELEREDSGVRLTVTNPLADSPRRVETADAHTSQELEQGLAIVLDHLAGA